MLNNLFLSILTLAETYPVPAKYITTSLRWIFLFLAVYILLTSIISLLSTRATPEVWGYLIQDEGGSLPITHWESIIGRSGSADLQVKNDTVSKTQAALVRRANGTWIL